MIDGRDLITLIGSTEFCIESNVFGMRAPLQIAGPIVGNIVIFVMDKGFRRIISLQECLCDKKRDIVCLQFAQLVS